MSGDVELRVSLHAITAPPVPSPTITSPGPVLGARHTGMPLADHGVSPRGVKRWAMMSTLGASPRTSSYQVMITPPALSDANATPNWFERIDDTRLAFAPNRRAPVLATRCTQSRDLPLAASGRAMTR